jgi:hypothetical protein
MIGDNATLAGKRVSVGRGLIYVWAYLCVLM